MLRYTANYANTNHNFVIQNLDGERTKSNFLAVICILKNILQRGTPTMMSEFLKENIGKVHEEMIFKHPLSLISSEPPQWLSRIKGDEKNNYYPAKEFLFDLIPKYLPEYCFIRQLILPEAEINEIAQVNVDSFNNQRVDFYLPQAKLVVEIDGQHHKIHDHTRINDKLRDKYLASHGIKTVRIDTRDLTTRSEKFVSKINSIKNRLNEFHTILNHYRLPFEEPAKTYSSESGKIKLLSTAVIRFQLLILELLERDKLRCEAPEWKFNVLNRDVQSYAQLAIDDVCLWLEHICKLQRLDFRKPKIRVSEVSVEKKFSFHPEAINIDFSLLRRWTDENELTPNLIAVRTDYYDYQKGKRDYGKICVTDPIAYNLTPYAENEDTQLLRFFLKNIFNYNNFKDGQLRIISNALSLRHTIGLLPTSGGKSLCYQLAALLQPAISFVVCPIKSLMYDQKYNLEKLFVNRTAYITGDQAAEKKTKVASDFAKGRYLWIWISPERLQSKDFRDELTTLNKNLIISYAVIDEVHCLSEWGHDFRTSYLNLSKTIGTYLPASTFLGLTATASVNVLKDIKNEFGIKDEDVKTLTHYSRPELEFRIINARDNKKAVTISLLKKLLGENNTLQSSEGRIDNGLIFTPHVNGPFGCYDLANDLSRELKTEIRWFSGKVPKKKGPDMKRVPVLTPKEFNSHKMNAQREFHENKYPILVATKAFGMGVNKTNIRFTIHYGIPGSMESLYQEAGRAGRDGKSATCYVIFSPEIVSREILDKVFGFSTGLRYIRDIMDEMNESDDRGNDAFRVLYLWLYQQQFLDDELAMIMKLKTLCQPGACKTVNATDVCSKHEEESSRILVEKAIYRLSILGVIEDWTVADWFRGVFMVQVSDYNDKTIRQRLVNYIMKYDPEFDYSKAVKPHLGYEEDERPVLVLLEWIYNHFGYYRRQSIKNVYEICEEFAMKGPDASSWFKKELESMFKFSEVSHALDEIAEKPADIEKWFSIFYADHDHCSSKIISKDKLHSLKGSLARFLESYQFNTGLNMISGIVRLMLDDFVNPDGKQRMVSAIQHVCNSEEYNSYAVLGKLLEVGSKLKVSARQELSSVLLEYFGDNVEEIYEALNDDASLAVILDNAAKRLMEIGGILYDRCKETTEQY